MKDSFWELIWSSFLEIQGVLIGSLGIFITILLSRFPVKTQIPLDLVITISFFSLLFFATLVQASSKSFRKYKELSQVKQDMELRLQQRVIPKILYAVKEQNQQTNLQIRCLLERSELFSNDTCISFYYTDDDGFERLVGLGVVLTLQANGTIQALLDTPVLPYQEILEKLASNDVKIRERTVVKPSITRNMMFHYLFTLE